MKRIAMSLSIMVFLLSALAITVTAEVPRLIAYQGRLLDSTGAPVADGAYLLKFIIWNDQVATGTANLKWNSNFQPVTTTDGLFTYYVGSATLLPSSLFATDTSLYLGVTEGANPEMQPRTKLASAAYSFKAAFADNSGLLDGLNSTAFADTGHSHVVTTAEIVNGTILFEDIAPNGAASGQVMKWNGNAWLPANDSSGGVANWTLIDTVLYTSDNWGIARGNAGNSLLGDSAFTAVNLGVACTTGTAAEITPFTTVGGGYGNSSIQMYGTVSGGRFNLAAGTAATVSGGQNCLARGQFSVVSGGGGGNIADTNSASGDYSVVAGGARNAAMGTFSVTGGGINNTSSGSQSIVGGGLRNSATGPRSTVGGGSENTAGSQHSTVAGGTFNIASGLGATIGGGSYNSARGSFSVVAGGGGLFPADSNTAAGQYSSIGGGTRNRAAGYYSTVGGGSTNNTVSLYSGVSSGLSNKAGNLFNDTAAFVGGGKNNTAGAKFAAIAGGSQNSATAAYSSILGGFGNTIETTGEFSFLFGVNSSLTQDSTFMVDMPHIRFGDEVTGYEFPSADGTAGQQLITNGSGRLAWSTFTSTNSWKNVASGVVLVTNSDLVGIGTLTPTVKLDVAGDIVGSGKIAIGPSNTNSGTNAIVLGQHNNVSGNNAAIGGGRFNIASAYMSVVSGGYFNSASDTAANVGGGQENFASAKFATVAGGWHDSASGIYSAVGGGYFNSAVGHASFVGGGNANVATGGASMIGGGMANAAVGDRSTVGGGYKNIAAAPLSTVGGGSYNNARGLYSVVAGGGGSVPADSNAASGQYAAVGGGTQNHAAGFYSTISGGATNNTIGNHSGVSSGLSNIAGKVFTDSAAYVGGGRKNAALAKYAAIGGGWNNQVTGQNGFIGGGLNNISAGAYSSIAGGASNSAIGRFSFAAGFDAKANHDGSIVLSAQNGGSPIDSVSSSGVNQVVLRAAGGFYLTKNAGTAFIPTGRFLNTSTGGYLSTSGTWINLSDRNSKENFETVDGNEILKSLEQLPINRWNYKVDEDSITHIGPTAQDFYKAFGVGNDDKSISTIDPSGLALAAIKELYRKTKKLEQVEEELAQIKDVIQKMQKAIDSMKK